MEDLVMVALLNAARHDQIQAAAELNNFTSKQKQKLVERGIVYPLLSMLNSQDYEAVEAALLALLSLAYGSERNKMRIARSGAIPVVLPLLRCQSTTLMELAIATLFILSSCTGNRVGMASAGAIPFLVEVLSTTSISMQAKLDVLGTFHNLSTCNQIIPMLISSELVLYLLQMIEECEKSSDLVEKSTALLERIAGSPEPTLIRKIAATDGAIRVLVEIIEEGSPQCKEHAVGILLLICQSSREKYRGLMLREGIMPGLLQLSVDGTWRAKNLSRALLLLLRDVSSNGSKAKEVKNEILERIMERIDAEGDGLNGSALLLVEEMMSKLSA